MNTLRRDPALVIMLAGCFAIMAAAIWGVVNGPIWDGEPTPRATTTTSFINGGDGDNVRVLP